MPTPINVLMWNLRFFSESSINTVNKLNRIVNRVQPTAVGPPLCDIFIIIEPDKLSPQPTNVGEVMYSGSSINALRTMYSTLIKRRASWRMVPPRALAVSNAKEVHGVFYDSATVTFTGPNLVPIAPPAAMVPAFGGPGNLPVGQVRHHDAAGAEVNFGAGNRRPYRCAFTTVAAPNTPFDIYSVHAPPEGKYPENVKCIRAIANINAVANPGGTPTMITGDFNCCNRAPPCPNKQNGHDLNEINAQNDLTNAAGPNYTTHIVNDPSSLKTPTSMVIASPNDYRLHAFDHVLTKNFDAVPNAAVVDVVGTDAGFAAAVASGYTGTFRSFYKQIYRGPGGDGISDHMPVQVTLVMP